MDNTFNRLRLSSTAALLTVVVAGCGIDQTSTSGLDEVQGTAWSDGGTDGYDDAWGSSTAFPGTSGSSGHGTESSDGVTSTGEAPPDGSTTGGETGVPPDDPAECEPGIPHAAVCSAIATQSFACDPTQHGTLELAAASCEAALDLDAGEDCQAALLGKLLCLATAPCASDAGPAQTCAGALSHFALTCQL